MKLDEVADILDALSQKNRLKIFKLLVKNSQTGMTPTQISDQMGAMPRNTLSFHLSALTHVGLCSFEKIGKQVVYKPKCKTVKKVVKFLLKDCCDGGCEC